jgi:hypothetical protein
MSTFTCIYDERVRALAGAIVRWDRRLSHLEGMLCRAIAASGLDRLPDGTPLRMLLEALGRAADQFRSSKRCDMRCLLCCRGRPSELRIAALGHDGGTSVFYLVVCPACYDLPPDRFQDRMEWEMSGHSAGSVEVPTAHADTFPFSGLDGLLLRPVPEGRKIEDYPLATIAERAAEREASARRDAARQARKAPRKAKSLAARDRTVVARYRDATANPLGDLHQRMKAVVEGAHRIGLEDIDLALWNAIFDLETEVKYHEPAFSKRNVR